MPLREEDNALQSEDSGQGGGCHYGRRSGQEAADGWSRHDRLSAGETLDFAISWIAAFHNSLQRAQRMP
jgi:hypothetical protein